MVSSRHRVKKALDQCMLTTFIRYGIELEDIQRIYERDKVTNSVYSCCSLSLYIYYIIVCTYIQSCPNTSRGAPPVTTAVQWSRHLLSKVQKPMETFRKSPVVMQSMVTSICQLHSIGTTLTFICTGIHGDMPATQQAGHSFA